MKYRWLWAAACIGVGLHLAGLGWDAYMHAKDSTLAEREGVFTLANPSHALILAGLALTSGSLLGVAFAWAQDRRLGGSGPLAGAVRLATLPCVALAAAGSIWIATLADDASAHSHADAASTVDDGHDHSAEAVQATAGQPQAAPPAQSAEGHSHDTTGAMSEGNAEVHGNEVDVTAEQLQAASAFYEQVKEQTQKYEDIRAGIADGYIQVTQDLPGIAAHFVNFNYNNDGTLMDPTKPEALLYTKRLNGEWRLVGAMFMSEKVTDDPPSFFGPLDSWHRHENLCFTPNAVSVKQNKESCPGVFQAKTAWMLHVWTAPGASGAFAHDFAPISPGAFPGATRPASQDFVTRR